MITLLSLILWLTAQSSPGSITGVALRAGTTQALANVDIELRPSLLVSRSDAGGRFSFPAVPPGSYTLAVERDGMRLQVPVVLAFGQKLERVVLRVNSAPTIAGTVYDLNGERLAAARVQAYQWLYTPYGLRLRTVMSTLTDELGQYRLFWLRPGEYYVAASYSDRDQRAAIAELRLSPNLSKPDDGYIPIYFGGSFTPPQSQKVSLSPGVDSTGVNLYFKDGARFTIFGEIVPPSCPVRLALVPEGDVISEDGGFGVEACGDEFQIRGVSPGYYRLLAIAKGAASDVIAVSVANKEVRVKVPLSDTARLFGQVVMGGRRTGLNSSGAQVRLIRSSREIDQRIQGTVNPDGSFLIEDVGPGEYDVALDPHPANTYVRSIRLGARDVTAGRMRIDSSMSSNPPSLEIALSSSGGIAEGAVVDRSGQPVAGAQVVLVPLVFGVSAFGAREDRYKLALSDAAGNFRVSGITPGGYTAFAFEQIDPGAYFAFAYDAQLFNGYRGKGISVNFTDTGRQTVRLVAVPAEETAAGLR